MNTMRIFLDADDGNWYVSISDSYEELFRYQFAGDLETQEASVKAMGQAMVNGNTEDWDVFFENTDEPDMASILLTNTEAIYVAGSTTPAWEAAAPDVSAWEEIAAAGEEILDALPF